MSIKTNELPLFNTVAPGDCFLMDTSAGTGRVAYGTLVPNTVGAHNSIYRGKDLTAMSNDEIHSRLEAGDFSEFYIGDYFDRTSTDSIFGTKTMRYRIAGINHYMGHGDSTYNTKNHLVLVPDSCFGNAQMNETNTTEGGYAGSKMHTVTLPEVFIGVNAAFGGHLMTSRELLTNAMNPDIPSMAGAGWNGATTGWAWTDCGCRLMSEVEVYGSTVFSSSFYDVGNAKTQLPLFRFRPDMQSMRSFRVWLSSVTSATRFAGVANGGDATSRDASDSLGVRPRFLIA